MPYDEYTCVVEVSINGIDFSYDETVYTYTDELVLGEAYPLIGPTTGGTNISFNILAGNYQNETVMCRFGSYDVIGLVKSDMHSVLCTSPPLNKPGVFKLSLKIGDKFCSTDYVFAYVDIPIVSSMYPVEGLASGGWHLHLQYEEYSSIFTRVGESKLFCRFKTDEDSLFGVDRVVAAISTTYGGYCVVPSLTPRRKQSVEISVNRFDYTFVGYVGIVPKIELVSISPDFGPISGGETIVVEGFGMDESFGELCCIFDGASFDMKSKSFSINGHFSGECIPPAVYASKSVEVRVEICSNSEDMSMDPIFLNVTKVLSPYYNNNSRPSTTYKYIDSNESHSIYPNNGFIEGGTLLKISGLDSASIYDTTAYKCRFELNTIDGVTEYSDVVINKETSALGCISPAVTAEGNALLVVSNVYTNETILRSFFTYISKPSDLSAYPMVGNDLGGTTISITKLNDRTVFDFVQYGPVSFCKFGNSVVSAEATIIDNESMILCSSPRMVESESRVVPLSISPNGIDFLPLKDKCQSQIMFTYIPKPRILSIVPEKITHLTSYIKIFGENLIVNSDDDDHCEESDILENDSNGTALVGCCVFSSGEHDNFPLQARKWSSMNDVDEIECPVPDEWDRIVSDFEFKVFYSFQCRRNQYPLLNKESMMDRSDIKSLMRLHIPSDITIRPTFGYKDSNTALIITANIDGFASNVVSFTNISCEFSANDKSTSRRVRSHFIKRYTNNMNNYLMWSCVTPLDLITTSIISSSLDIMRVGIKVDDGVTMYPSINRLFTLIPKPSIRAISPIIVLRGKAAILRILGEQLYYADAEGVSLCRVGSRTFPLIMKDNHEASCIVDLATFGNHSVSISLNGQDFISAIHDNHYTNVNATNSMSILSSYSSMQLRVISPVRITQLHPRKLFERSTVDEQSDIYVTIQGIQSSLSELYNMYTFNKISEHVMCRIDDISIRAQFKILENNNGMGTVICMLSQSNILVSKGTYELDIVLSSGQSLLSTSEISHIVSVRKMPDFFQISPSSLNYYYKDKNVDVNIQWSAESKNPFNFDEVNYGVNDSKSLLFCHFDADYSMSNVVVRATRIDQNKIQCRMSESLMGSLFFGSLHDVLYITISLSDQGSDVAQIGKITMMKGFEVNYIEPHIILSGMGTNLTISGHNFRSNSNLGCVIGQSYYPARIMNSTLMTCEIPGLTNIGTFNLSIQCRNVTMDYISDRSYRIDVVNIPTFDDNYDVSSSSQTIKYCQLRVNDNNYDQIWFTGKGFKNLVDNGSLRSMMCSYKEVADIPAVIVNDTHVYCPCGVHDHSMMTVAGSNFMKSLENDGFVSVLLEVGLYGSQGLFLRRNATFYHEPIFKTLTSPFVSRNTRINFEI
jgi:hypothetical protein